MDSCKSKTRFIPATFAWLLLIVSTSLFFVFPCQYLQRVYHISVIIFQGIITVFVISNFFLATFMDPGIIPKASPEEDDDDDILAPLYKSVEVNGTTIRMKWCVTCKFYRPPRCSHCSVCNTCIETFDHHCPWVNNCIGRRNYRHFFFFLVFLSVHMMTIFGWCLLFILDHKEKLHEKESIISLSLMALIILLIIPIIGLTGFHTILVSRGRTTNEQVTGKFQDNFNPFSRGCFLNWCYILCGPSYPRYKLSKKRRNFNLTDYNLPEPNGNDKIVKVYLDNDDKNSNGKNLSTKYLLNKPAESNKNSNYLVNEKNLIKMERIESIVESQSRDCEPSPLISLNSQGVDSWQKNYINKSQINFSNLPEFNAYGNSKTSYTYNPGNNSNATQLTSSQSQLLYNQHYPINSRNGKYENQQTHTGIAAQKQSTTNHDKKDFNVHYTNTTTGNQQQPHHPHYYHHHHQYNVRPISPAKSTSISEISPFAQQQYSKQNNKSGNSAHHGGVVVYYSPDEASNSLMITDLDNVGKFASETELQKLKENLIYPGASEQNANKNNFFSKRPMSFMKALEITDKFDRNNSKNQNVKNNSNQPEGTKLTAESNKEDTRHSQYEMNYEISV